MLRAAPHLKKGTLELERAERTWRRMILLKYKGLSKSNTECSAALIRDSWTSSEK